MGRDGKPEGGILMNLNFSKALVSYLGTVWHKVLRGRQISVRRENAEITNDHALNYRIIKDTYETFVFLGFFSCEDFINS